jgi:hypothetical protein
MEAPVYNWQKLQRQLSRSSEPGHKKTSRSHPLEQPLKHGAVVVDVELVAAALVGGHVIGGDLEHIKSTSACQQAHGTCMGAHLAEEVLQAAPG